MAEAKPTVSEDAEITQVLTYLREREQELSHYSDKLRTAINKIVAVFGSKYYCRICDRTQTETKNGKPIHYRYLVHYTSPTSPKVLSYFGNELPSVLGNCKVVPEKGDMCVNYKQKIAYAHENPDYHTFVPKIYISIPIIDEAPFYKDETEGYELRLMIEDGYLVAWDSRGGEYNTTHSITSLSREKIKALVKSGRIPAFLKLVQQKLDEKTEEYKQVAEMAERLMKAMTQ